MMTESSGEDNERSTLMGVHIRIYDVIDGLVRKSNDCLVDGLEAVNSIRRNKSVDVLLGMFGSIDNIHSHRTSGRGSADLVSHKLIMQSRDEANQQ